MSSSDEYVIAVIGAGPRGTTFLERLLAHVEESSASSWPRLRVTIYDPAPHGPGKVWDPQQSRLYLMNTPASFPTAAPSGKTKDQLVSSTASVSFADYGHVHGLHHDAAAYPTRADYGAYLAWMNKDVSARLRGRGVAVDHVRSEVLGLSQEDGRYTLDIGATSRGADAVVLALGHLPTRPTGPAGHLARSAQRMGLHYTRPAIPTETDYSAFPAGGSVLVRGMGLNFFDLITQLSAGRGGSFKYVDGADPGNRLEYQPSGREPQIIAGARRGTPYRAKTTASGFVPHGITLTHFTPEAVAELVEEHHQLDFLEHLWPLIDADAQQAFINAGGDSSETFDIDYYAKPFAQQHFASHAEYQQAMLHWLAEDAAASAAGTASPHKMAVNALHAARLQLKPLIAQEQITPESRIKHIEGWFEPLIEGLASGPPLQRIEELAALARAGVVEFLGPEPSFGIDGRQRCFLVDSPYVEGVRHTAEYMVEAMMPPNRITQADSSLVNDLLASGLAAPATFTYDAGTHVHKGFSTTPRPHQLRGAEGQTIEGIYPLGMQLASVQWGTAIAAEDGGDIATTAVQLADADAAALDILHRATATLAEEPQAESAPADQTAVDVAAAEHALALESSSAEPSSVGPAVSAEDTAPEEAGPEDPEVDHTDAEDADDFVPDDADPENIDSEDVELVGAESDRVTTDATRGDSTDIEDTDLDEGFAETDPAASDA